MLGWVSFLQPAKFWLKFIPHILLILRRELWDSVVSPLRTGPRSLGSPCCGACSGMFLRQMLHQKITALISGRSLFWLNVQHHLKRGFKGLSFFLKKKQTLMSVWITSALEILCSNLLCFSKLKDASLRMVNLCFFAGRQNPVLKISSSVNTPWGRDCLFDKKQFVVPHEKSYKERSTRPCRRKKKDSVRLWPRWRNRFFPTCLVWWPWKVHIQWCLSAKQVPWSFPSHLWSVMTPPY